MDKEKLDALRTFLNSMREDANQIYYNEDRIIDNSCCTSASYYIEARAANDAELEKRIAEIEKIAEMFGINMSQDCAD